MEKRARPGRIAPSQPRPVSPRAGPASGGYLAALAADDALVVLLLSLDDEALLVELLALLLEPPFLFEPPEYRSEYQPPPLRMKLPEVICRFARGWLHDGHSFNGSSEMRCTRSNS
jgi:hypothetical protein